MLATLTRSECVSGCNSCYQRMRQSMSIEIQFFITLLELYMFWDISLKACFHGAKHLQLQVAE